MRLPRLAIQNHQFTLVLVALLFTLGVVSFLTMPRSEDPSVQPAGASVFVIYPGATPADIEELIVDPLETAINEIEDINRLNGSAEDGIGIIGVEFTSGNDPDEKYSEFVQKVNSVRNQLPDDIFSIELLKWSIADVNILQIALLSESESYARLEEEADNLKRKLEKAPGVRRVETHAIPQQEVRIAVKLEKMAAFKISLNQLMGALQAANQNIPGGFLDIDTKRYNIQTSGSYESLNDIKNTIVHAGNGKIVYLKDVADVFFAHEETKYLARVNDVPAVFVTVQQKDKTNIFSVMQEVKAQIDKFKEELPPTISVEYVFDQSVSVANRLNTFFGNLLQGLVLVGLVVFVAVGYRAAGIVIMVIPFSLLFGIGFIDLSGYGLQQMTIAGLVIALGLLVDNAIVVTENIARFMRLGYSRFEAAAQGTSQVAWAIVSATVTTVLAFVPMMMMGNVTGDFIRSMPLTVIYTLMASLFLSLTFTPYLSSKFLNVEKSSKRRLRQWMNKFVETHYRRTLDRALNKPVFFVVLAVVVFLSSFALFPIIGVSFFPKAEKPQFIIDITTPSGTNLAETDRVAQDVERALGEFDNVRYVVANVGHGNPRIYYNVFPQRDRATYAQIFVQLQEFELKDFYDTLHALRERFADYPGAKIEVKEFEQGPHVEAPIAIRLLGDNLEVLETISREVEDMFLSTPGTINVNNPLSTSKTDLYVKINREKAGMLGVPLVEIDKAIRAGMSGLTISRYRDPEGEEFDIVVRLPYKDKARLEDFSKIYITSMTGAAIPLKSVAAIEFKATQKQIDHYNMERTVIITSDVADDFSVDGVTREIVAKVDGYDFPKGYRYSIGGELESREESFGGMLQAIIVALIGIFAVLVLQFKSYNQPLIVFSAIPLAFIGSVLALLITGHSFSFTAFIGLTSLVGIVVNNSIILVDYTNQLRAEGKDVVSALKEAGETRFIPIVLTTATTVGGLLPLTLIGGSLFAPMGWTIIGGLMVSTFLTLVIVPVLYKLLTKVNGEAKAAAA
ncbi:efflux RND transporter permease subunit [candidate division KSB1 bacterium]|nr:efflux RND transporter permease subunit [candidate division KSB1 bacterium]RQW02856.1 MAG: efflux RND transporter permease subunit [candidate division KSB1 bacterium]